VFGPLCWYDAGENKRSSPTVWESYFAHGLWQIGGFGVAEPTHWQPLPAPPPPAVAPLGKCYECGGDLAPWCPKCNGADDAAVAHDAGALGEAVLEAAKTWHAFQSAENTTALYLAVSRLTGAKFDPSEYDNVE
jgi:hypothetical protein